MFFLRSTKISFSRNFLPTVDGKYRSAAAPLVCNFKIDRTKAQRFQRKLAKTQIKRILYMKCLILEKYPKFRNATEYCMVKVSINHKLFGSHFFELSPFPLHIAKCSYELTFKWIKTILNVFSHI